LSIFDKIIEKLMYKCLSNFVKNTNILYECQFGFGKNYSTSQAVMEVVDSIHQSRDSHEIMMGIFLDIQNAFDTIDHLELHGIRGIVLKWFSNYLSNRKQYTVLQNYESRLESVTQGVDWEVACAHLFYL